MNDLYFAASPPSPVPAPTVQLAPRKMDERDIAAPDFEKVLKAKEKEMRAVDVSRTSHPAERRTTRTPENSSQGGADAVGAAVHHKDMKSSKSREAVHKSSTSEEEKQDNGVEATSQNNAGGDPTAGAGSVTPQSAAEAKDQAKPANTAAQTISTETAAIIDPTAANGTAPQVDAAQAAQTTDQPAAEVKSTVESGFSQALQQIQKDNGEKSAVPAPETNGADIAQTAAAGQQQTFPTKTAQPAQEAVEKVTPTVQKSVRAVEGAGDSASQKGVSQNMGGAPSQGMAAQTTELKAVGASAAAQNSAGKVESRALDMIQQVAKTVEASIQQGRNSLRMQLNPADLGAIDIRLVSSGHRVSMTVIAEQASTGRMLESQVEQLRQNLADAGVQLSQMHVSQQDAGGAFGRGFAQQQHATPSGLRQAPFSGASESETADERQTRMRTPGQVDYRI